MYPEEILTALAAYDYGKRGRDIRTYAATHPPLEDLLVNLHEHLPDEKYPDFYAESLRNCAIDLLVPTWDLIRAHAKDSPGGDPFPGDLVELLAGYDCTTLKRGANRNPGFEGAPGYPVKFLHCLPESVQEEYRAEARARLALIWPLITKTETTNVID